MDVHKNYFHILWSRISVCLRSLIFDIRDIAGVGLSPSSVEEIVLLMTVFSLLLRNNRCDGQDRTQVILILG
jgi:hypothetical protein